MHAAVDFAAREIRLELLGEQALRADRAQRLVEALVAGRAVRLELGVDSARRERGLHLTRLPERELRRARGDDECLPGAGVTLRSPPRRSAP